MNAAAMPEANFADLARLACRVASVPVAVIGFSAEGGVQIAVQTGLSESEEEFARRLCRRMIDEGGRLEVADFKRDTTLEVPDSPEGLERLQFFSGALLPTASGEDPWFLGVFDRAPRRFTPEQRTGLQTIGNQVVLRQELRRSTTDLAHAAARHERSEAALREQETFYRKLIESLPSRLALFRKDIEGRFTFVNRRFCEFLRSTEEKVLGRDDFAFAPPEIARKFREDDMAVIGSGQSFETTERNITPDGCVHWFHVIKTPLYDSKGEPAGIQGIFWDVTKERAAEEALAHESALLHALLDHAPDAIYFKDRESKILRASKALAVKLGRSDPAELIGRTDRELFTAEHADQALADERRIMETGIGMLGFTERETHPDGRVTYALTDKLPFRDQQGNIIGTFGISRDVTALKMAQERAEKAQAKAEDAEKKFRDIVENARDGIYQTTQDGHYLSANPALAAIYGFASPDDLIRDRTDIQTQVYVDPGRRAEFERLMSEHGVVDQFESQVYRKDGKVIWISENARAVRGPGGKLLYYEGTVENIHEKKLAAERLEKANAALEEARDEAVESARTKAQFLANTSHELRTPMNAIIGFTELLLDTPLTVEQRDYADKVRSSARALLTLLNDILDFSKIESGKLMVEKLDFHLRHLVEDTAEFMAELAFSKGLRFALWIDHALPRTVRGDPTRVRQVLTNLLGNAIKFTPRGEVELRVLSMAGPKDVVTVRFEVRDTGVGIPAQAQSKIFEAFTQADGSTTRKFGGSGLGLSISRQLAHLLDGDISFESSEGRGSTFRFTLRLGQAAEAAGAETEATTKFPGVRVLIADSHRASSNSLQHELGLLGCAITAVYTAADAITALREATAAGRPFDVAVLDLQLPDLDGHGLAHQIHLDPNLGPTRLILMAPLGQRLDPDVLRAAGIRGFLVKPIKQARLHECLGGVLTRGDALMGALVEKDNTQQLKSRVPRMSSTIRLLLVEDNLVNQKVAQAQLRRLGHVADVANNGVEALGMLTRSDYQIILMDCQMPELDGYETTRRIRRNEADSLYGLRRPHHIIALTANAMAGDREKCLEAGMDDFLTKPLELEALRQSLVRGAEVLGIPVLEQGENARPPGVVSGGGNPVPAQPAANPIPAEALAEPVLDSKLLDTLRSMQIPGQPDEAAELIGLFLGDLGPRLDALAKGIANRDADAAKPAAHSLKGSSGNIGARRFAAVAAAVDLALKEGEWQRAAETMPALESAAIELRRTLESYSATAV